MNVPRWAPITVLTAAVLLTSTACSPSSKQTMEFKDAPVADMNHDSAHVVEMPDGFNNLAWKCVGSDLFATTFHNDGAYGSVTVSANDPLCK